MTKDNEKKFHALVQDISSDMRTQQMKQFIQHGRISAYDHCMRVARMSYSIHMLLHMNCNERELIRGAFLHDYFLYDWHDGYEQVEDPDWIFPARYAHHLFHMHGFTHPETAMKNADRDFDLTQKEVQIIRSHMWPLTLLHPPKSREAFVVCAADKIVSLQETVMLR